MRELFVLSVSPDGRHVLLGATKGADKGTHRVRLDARLIAAVRGELGAEQVELSPKDIQARLRAGETVEQIARDAGVAVTRIERYAGPVAGEMARMINAAREAFLVRGRRGPSSVSLGTAIDAALGGDTATWSARRDEDGRWLITATWTARGREREASWFYEPHEKVLSAADPGSAALGHVDANPPAVRKPAKPAAKPPAKPAASSRGAKAPAPSRAANKPRLQVVPDPPKPAPRKKAAPKAASKPAPKATQKPTQKPTQKSAASAADERDGVRARASVPGWADVLLGATPPQA